MKPTLKGTLIPIGGNEDKGIEENEKYTLEYIQEGILSRVVQESGGQDSLIIVITSASSIPVQVGKVYQKAFEKLGCTNVHIFDIRSQEDAEKPQYIELMRRAKCVMFSGGDQSRIVKFIKDTKLDDIIKEKYRDEEFVIAGTSAGAMCMSSEMIAGGGNLETMRKGSVIMSKGMGFNPHLIIDSHFIQRRRFGRLAEACALFPKLIGIGLAEDTGLVIKNGRECEVIGSGMMILFDPRMLTHNNTSIVEEGNPMSVANLKIHILAAGDTITIGEAEVLISLARKMREQSEIPG